MTASYQIIERHRRDRLGEGPLWSPRQNAVYWVDIVGQRLNRIILDSHACASWYVAEPIGWIIERQREAGFIAGLRRGFATVEIDPVRIHIFASLDSNIADNRPNDAVADRADHIWTGTMSLGGSRADSSLYRLDPEFRVTRVDTGYRIANGPAISPDGRFLYHADSAIGLVYRFELRKDGTLGAREKFIRFADDWGSPDGMTVDREGGLWIAHRGGGCISRFTSDGVRERHILLPASQITNCVFAGENLDRMFVTSAADGVDEEHGGALIEIDPGCRGLPPTYFNGPPAR